MKLFFVLLVLLSAFGSAIWNLFLKKIINNGADHRAAYWLSNCVGLVLYAVPAVFVLHRTAVDTTGLLFAFLTGLLFAVQTIFITVLYKFDDLSKAYPLMKTRPIFAFSIGAIVLNEELTVLEIFGIIIVCTGSYLMNLEKFTIQNFLRPKIHWRTLLIAGGSAALGSLYGLTTKMGGPHAHPLVFGYLSFTVSVLALTPLVYRCHVSLGQELQKYWKYFTAISIVDFACFSIVVFLLISGKLSSIAALQQASIIFATLLGILVLHERHGKTRLVAAVVIMLGLILVSSGNN